MHGMKRYFALLVFAAISALAAYSGANFEPGLWYDELIKPDCTPPNWLFGPVWFVLYVFVAVAGWKIWKHQGLGLALLLWFVQLGLNALWSYLMFEANNITAALIDIGLLIIAIIAFIEAARQVSPLAAGLFVPYLLWVLFAAMLNAAIWQLNVAV